MVKLIEKPMDKSAVTTLSHIWEKNIKECEDKLPELVDLFIKTIINIITDYSKSGVKKVVIQLYDIPCLNVKDKPYSRLEENCRNFDKTDFDPFFVHEIITSRKTQNLFYSRFYAQTGKRVFGEVSLRAFSYLDEKIIRYTKCFKCVIYLKNSQCIIS